MAISSVIEKLGRAIFEAPFGSHRLSKDVPELAEIRLAVLDAVKAKSHRAAGKSVFAYNLVRVEIKGVPEEQASLFQGSFLADYLAQELKSGLTRSGYRFPQDLGIEISTTPRLPSSGEEWLCVETDLRENRAAWAGPNSRLIAKLVVITGTAARREYPLEKARINIGRTAEVYRSAGPSRQNDIVFTEDNEVNRTVSREHAHILYSESTGVYRLFNDRWYKGEENCGIWIVRDGLGHPVHRSSRGTVLKPGDEIHLGTAVLRFEFDVSS